MGWQGGADATLSKGGGRWGEAVYTQFFVIVGIDGRNGTIVVNKPDYLSVFIDKWATYGILWCGIAENIVVVGGVKLLYATDILLLVLWLFDGVGTQPYLVASF